MARPFRAVHLDVGTGDGRYVQHVARVRPDWLVIGVDAVAENLKDVSHRVSRKPARGGLPNALFGVLPLEQAPGELAALAGELTVLFPWGSLLAAVAVPGVEGLVRLRGLCAPGAAVRVLFGYGESADPAARQLLGVGPERYLERALTLRSAYREAGFAEVAARPVPLDEVAAEPTTWSRTLAHSGKVRRFFEIRARAA